MDLASSNLGVEEVADERTYETWNTLVAARLEALGVRRLSLVSDRAKALVQLAETGLDCLSIPELFHLIHDLVKSYALALGRRLQQAHRDLDGAQGPLRKCLGSPSSAPTLQQAQARVEACVVEVTRWESVRLSSRRPLERVSLIVPLWCLIDSTRQSSPEVEHQLQAEINALETFVDTHGLPVKSTTLDKVRKQLAGVATLLDFWWQGVEQDVEQVSLTPRCSRPLCLRGEQGEPEQAKAFQRASSAVEGRNGSLSQMHHNHRGLPTRRSKVWTELHHFDCRASDGTTPPHDFSGEDFQTSSKRYYRNWLIKPSNVTGYGEFKALFCTSASSV